MKAVNYFLFIVLVTSVLVIVLTRGSSAAQVLDSLSSFNTKTIAALQGRGF